MEYEKIYPFVLLVLLVGMVLGVGILVFDKFGTATRESSSTINESITLTAAAGQTTYTNVTSISFFGNVTNTSDSGELVLGEDINFSDSGVITTNSKLVNGAYNISYGFTVGNAAYDALIDTGTELGTIATTWLGLIITIFVLAVIMFMVIGSFNRR